MAGKEKRERNEAATSAAGGAEANDPAANAALVRRLRRSIAELTLLNELAQDIGGSLDSRTIIQKVVAKTLKAVGAEQAVINLVHGRSRDDPSTYVRAVASRAGHEQYHLDQSLVGCLYTDPTPVRTAAPGREERLRGVKVAKTVRSLLCVPLTVKDRLIGILAAYNKTGAREFTAADERLLAIIAGQSAQIIENARLYEQEKSLREVQVQLRMARQIQTNLLPAEMPTVAGYELAGASLPAAEVGGDYFDFVACGVNRWAVCVADVAGKGLPAALLMANLHAALRGQLGSDLDVAACVAAINRHLFRSTERSQFVSLFLSLLDPQTHRLTFCNAGHDRPIILPARGATGGEVRRLPSCGPVLGLVEDYNYREERIGFEPGDLLIVFSDGITEAVDRRDDEFGFVRLLKAIADSRKRSADGIAAAILDAVNRHAGDAHQHDDMTLVVLRRDS